MTSSTQSENQTPDGKLSSPSDSLQNGRSKTPAKKASLEGTGKQERWYDISELASAFNITTRTIRFYEEKGIVSPRREGTTRLFSHKDKVRLLLALRGKRLGFSLHEILNYLELYTADRSSEAQIHYAQERITCALDELKTRQKIITQTIWELEDVLRACDEDLAQIRSNSSPDAPDAREKK